MDEVSVSRTEYDGATLGDRRLERRLPRIAEALEEEPGRSFPEALDSAELEAFYRFVNNDRVSPQAVLAPHQSETVKRCETEGLVVSIADTSTFQFSTSREGLGRYGDRTFFGHFALALNLEGTPLGVLGTETWVRPKDSVSLRRRRGEITQAEVAQLPKEQDRWGRMVGRVEDALSGVAPVVHVMDSEADDYALLQELVGDELRFVIRGGGNRRVLLDDGSPAKMRDVVASCPVRCTREVRLSKRRGKKLKGTSGGKKRPRETPRDERSAKLSIGAVAVRIKAPSYFPGERKTTAVNVVCVRETKAPENMHPVEWFLMTTEPIETREDILRVVDLYRSRWKVEEFFKALKTGCRYEERQFGSYEALANVLAILIPIAWKLLRLRTLSRVDAGRPASVVLSESELLVLRHVAEKKLRKNPSLDEAMQAIARYGGHLKSNGRPGWLTLSRGYFRLQDLAIGFELARNL